VRRSPYVAAVALAVVVVLSFVTGSSAARRSSVAPGTAAVTATTVVCPAINGTPSNTVTTASFADVGKALSPRPLSGGTLVASTLLGKKSKSSKLHPVPVATVKSHSGSSFATAAAADGPVAATLGADEVGETATAGRYRALIGSNCQSPATNWWFAGADGRVGYTDTLILVNPAPTTAEVAVSLWTKKGQMSPPHLGAVPVPGRSRLSIGIASVAPDVATIALHVHANSGAVVAALIDRRFAALKSNGGDFLPPTASPARAGLIPGYLAGTGSRKLVLADSGQLDATVNLKLVTKSGSFAPSGANQVVVHQQHTKVVDLTKVFGGQTGAVEWTSDQPVVGEGMLVSSDPGLRPDLMWLAAIPPLSGPAAVATGSEPDGGKTFVVLTAPGGAGTARLTTASGKSSSIKVAAGTSIAVDVSGTINAGSGPAPFVVTPIGVAPVYGVRVLAFHGAHGALIAGEPLLSLPHPIQLPPVREDTRIAVR
jgi:hypothetical protein